VNAGASAGLASGTGIAYAPSVDTGGAPTVSAQAGCASGFGDAYNAITSTTVAGGSWWTLLSIVQQYKDPSYRQPRMLSCPNDGEPFRQGPNGEWYCKFDGYRPGAGQPYDLTGVGP
jgi:hypothetical protein